MECWEPKMIVDKAVLEWQEYKEACDRKKIRAMQDRLLMNYDE